jgi:integrase
VRVIEINLSSELENPSIRCTVPVRAKDDKLFFDFFWRGVRCKEYTGLADTVENRKICDRKIAAVDIAIERGTFDYRAHFPRGSRLHVFYPNDRGREGALLAFEAYITKWQRNRSPILPDGRIIQDSDIHPSTWIHDATVVRKRFVSAFRNLRLSEVTPYHCGELRQSLIEEGLSGKTVGNIMSLLHKAFADALDEGLVERNPVLRTSSRRARRNRRERISANPLTSSEVARFLELVPDWYRDFYTTWFYLGWRSSEIVALRFGWIDFERQHLKLQRGRIPRMGGLEAEPKTGRREVDCSYAPEILRAVLRMKVRSRSVSAEDFVFTGQNSKPLDQEWLNDFVWKPTLRRAGIIERGQYCIRDTFISLALSSGEDPGWVAQVCGTSEEMIFRHYRKWIPGLQVGAGKRISSLLQQAIGREKGRELSLKPSPRPVGPTKHELNQVFDLAERGGFEPPEPQGLT